MTTLSAAQRAGYTQDELDMLDGKITPDAPPAAEAAADPGAEDNEGADPDSAVEQTAEVAAPATEPAAEETAPAAEIAAAEPEPTTPPAKPAAFDVPDTAAMNAQNAELLDKKAVIFKQWEAGELSTDDYLVQTRSVDAQLMQIVKIEAEAAALQRINAQNAARAQAEAEAAENQAMYNVATASKAAGLIDYGTNKVASAQFDSLFAAAKLDPANAKLSAQQVVEKTHKAVLALNGLTDSTPAAATTAAAPAPAKPRNIPQTLANLPAAAVQPVGQGLEDEFSAITDPDVAEAKWASLPVATRQQMLRSTVPARRGRH